jgi:hypothetical protein
LVAVRRVLGEARKLRLIAHEDFLAATELPPIRLPARPPAGRDISLAELGAIFRTAAALAGDVMATWYSQGPEGYVDYPALESAAA